MNKLRRTRLQEAGRWLDRALDLVGDVCDEERSSLDNCPENLLSGESCRAMEEAIDELEEAISSIQEAAEHIDRARNGG